MRMLRALLSSTTSSTRRTTWLAFSLLFPLLWGCASGRPEREITAAFLSFVADLKAGNLVKAESTAPFLKDLPVDQKDGVIRSFLRFSGEAGAPTVEVVGGADGTYILKAAVPGGAAIAAPFSRDSEGRWKISPVLSAVQEIVVVPARQ